MASGFKMEDAFGRRGISVAPRDKSLEVAFGYYVPLPFISLHAQLTVIPESNMQTSEVHRAMRNRHFSAPMNMQIPTQLPRPRPRSLFRALDFAGVAKVLRRR